MADLIKFQCKACGKKMGVRAEYAGKNARCTGCKEPVRVPSPRPQRAATGVPVAAGKPASNSASAHGDLSSVSLDELAAMEQAAQAPVTEMTSRPGARAGAAQVNNGKACPGCGSAVKHEAVICIHCGHSFEGGKKLKTKKDSKLGKALAAATEPDEETESRPFITGGSGLILVGLGLATMLYDYDPTGSTRNWYGKLINYVYDTIGAYAAGGLLILGGVFLLALAGNALRQR